MNFDNLKNSPQKKSAASLRKEYICQIADKIQTLVTKEGFAPNDIMVLVQRRNPFAAPLVNELKTRGIEVAGSDRIILPQFPAIRDLLNLLRFCIDQTDDYCLCCTLKSPFYRLKEDDIFKICSAQQNTLRSDANSTVFDTLKTMRPEIYTELEKIVEWSKVDAPYTFFSKVLNDNNRREKLLAALGTQVIDPLEEFLTICLSYERTMPGTLRHFLKWFITGSAEIKRDMDAGSGVRIVTVHGSKGLEAPIVFLIDTVRTPKDKPTRILTLPNTDNSGSFDQFPVWLWMPQTKETERLNAATDFVMNSKISEYYRLLYVAMTRARDRLYIYGFTPNKKSPDIAWHTQLTGIISTMPGAKITDKIITVSND